jgi:hypothetical protein
MLKLALSTEATRALRQLAAGIYVVFSNTNLPSGRIYMAAWKTAAKIAGSS